MKKACLGLGFALAFALPTTRASACGGCFAPPQTESTVVTGHRMAFAVSPTRTVLWDQFQYSGSPADFSWVLPVKPGAYLESSDDVWFDALDAVTATNVTAPQLRCTNSGFSESGCACGTSSRDSAGGVAFSDGESVEVIHEGTVGPYDTVTVRSTDPSALSVWLTSHGYVIPAEIEPIITAYVTEGFDFIALRLSSGQGIQQMTPVRVVTPGADYSLPLRMVAAGAGPSVAITLFVIGEARYAMPDLAEARVETSDLVWDFQTQSSNYLALRAEALTQNSGETYLTTFAKGGAFYAATTNANFSGYRSLNGAIVSTLAELYLADAAGEAGACPSVIGNLRATELVARACEPSDPAGCIAPPAGSIDSSGFVCGAATDLEAAMIGMHPARVWVTRMEMNLPYAALDADCVVEPAVDQTAVDNWLLAEKYENPPCVEPIFSAALPRGSDIPPLIVIGCAIGLFVVRRKLGDTRLVAEA
jgi:hypothetical protein